jgi:hypothetical protein
MEAGTKGSRPKARFPLVDGVAMTMRTNASTTTEYGIAAATPAEKTRPIGVIGDGRPKQVDKGEVEERWKGWLPWESQLIF